MIGHGADTFIELGHGRILSGMMRRIDKTVRSFTAGDDASLASTLEALGA
jgi:[acyl-carrier-protein] S-malonyltransferase